MFRTFFLRLFVKEGLGLGIIRDLEVERLEDREGGIGVRLFFLIGVLIFVIEEVMVGEYELAAFLESKFGVVLGRESGRRGLSRGEKEKGDSDI